IPADHSRLVAIHLPDGRMKKTPLNRVERGFLSIMETGLSLITVHRETVGKRDDLFLHGLFDSGIAFVGIGNLQAVENFGDQRTDFLEFSNAETTRRAGRRAKTNAGRDERLFRVERNAVLVAGDVGAAK